MNLKQLNLIFTVLFLLWLTTIFAALLFTAGYKGLDNTKQSIFYGVVIVAVFFNALGHLKNTAIFHLIAVFGFTFFALIQLIYSGYIYKLNCDHIRCWQGTALTATLNFVPSLVLGIFGIFSSVHCYVKAKGDYVVLNERHNKSTSCIFEEKYFLFFNVLTLLLAIFEVLMCEVWQAMLIAQAGAIIAVGFNLLSSFTSAKKCYIGGIIGYATFGVGVNIILGVTIYQILTLRGHHYDDFIETVIFCLITNIFAIIGIVTTFDAYRKTCKTFRNIEIKQKSYDVLKNGIKTYKTLLPK